MSLHSHVPLQASVREKGQHGLLRGVGVREPGGGVAKITGQWWGGEAKQVWGYHRVKSQAADYLS